MVGVLDVVGDLDVLAHVDDVDVREGLAVDAGLLLMIWMSLPMLMMWMSLPMLMIFHG